MVQRLNVQVFSFGSELSLSLHFLLVRSVMKCYNNVTDKFWQQPERDLPFVKI